MQTWPTATREATTILDVQTTPDVRSSGVQCVYWPKEGWSEIDFAHRDPQLMSLTPADLQGHVFNTFLITWGRITKGLFMISINTFHWLMQDAALQWQNINCPVNNCECGICVFVLCLFVRFLNRQCHICIITKRERGSSLQTVLKTNSILTFSRTSESTYFLENTTSY